MTREGTTYLKPSTKKAVKQQRTQAAEDKRRRDLKNNAEIRVRMKELGYTSEDIETAALSNFSDQKKSNRIKGSLLPPPPGQLPRSFGQDLAMKKVIARDDPATEVIVYDTPENFKGVSKYTVEEVAAAASMSKGIKQEMARILRVSYATITSYINKWPDLQNVMDMAGEQVLDRAELKLQQHIDLNSLPALMFYLSTRGKNRGYTKRVEKATLTMDMSQLSDVQLKRIADGEAPDEVVMGKK